MSGPVRDTPVTMSTIEGWSPLTGWGGLHPVSILVDGPDEEPLTLDEAKLRAGFTWLPGDERDALLTDYIKAARQKVESDTGLALLTQTRDVFFDWIGTGVVTLPGQSSPLQQVESAGIRLSDGTTYLIDPEAFTIDGVSNPARLYLTSSVGMPAEAQTLQPWVIRIQAGWTSPAALPPLLKHAVGLLATHYLTLGRDVIAVGTIATDLPYGYDYAIAGFRPALIA